ncbi:MAG: post-COAP-1 domain-containing protein, partial [Chloroflexota bacterium]
TAPALLMPGTYPVAVGFAEDAFYLASTAQGTLTVQNTVGGKVTGGVGGDDRCGDDRENKGSKDDKDKGKSSGSDKDNKGKGDDCGSGSGAKGHGGFNVQATISGVKGELEFESKTVDFHARVMTALGISPDGKKAWFAGVGKDGKKFVVYVEDNGEPGRNDKFQLWIEGVPQNGDGSLTTGGNIQIHLKSSGDKDDKDDKDKSDKSKDDGKGGKS